MIGLFQFEFVQNAFLAGTVVAIVTAVVGYFVVLRAQALTGRTRMGFADDSGRRWVDCYFRSAFGLLSHDFKDGGIALRGEAFATRQAGTLVLADDGETGWATTVAAHRAVNRHLSLWVEALHVDSDRAARQRAGQDPHQHQDQLQLVMRGTW